MTRNEQNKILDAKIESNVNQYKVDRMNAEISTFSRGEQSTSRESLLIMRDKPSLNRNINSAPLYLFDKVS